MICRDKIAVDVKRVSLYPLGCLTVQENYI